MRKVAKVAQIVTQQGACAETGRSIARGALPVPALAPLVQLLCSIGGREDAINDADALEATPLMLAEDPSTWSPGP